MQIIERIFEIMNNKNLRSIDLANRIGVSKGVVSSWKTRKKNPPSEYIVEICKFLQVSTDYLLTGAHEVEISETNNSVLKNKERELSKEDLEILNIFHSLPRPEQIIILGEMYKFRKDIDSRNSSINNSCTSVESTHEEGFHDDQKEAI